MKKKWIYIETYVFIWRDGDNYLFYNSLNGKRILVELNGGLKNIVDRLLLKESFYCTVLPNNFTHQKELANFIDQLVSNQMGNVTICSEADRPVNIPPKLMLGKSVGNLEYFDAKVLENVNELTIQVTGECNLDCKNCSDYYLQLNHCYKRSSHFLSNEQLTNLSHQIKKLKLRKLNILGGNLLTFEHFESMVNIFRSLEVMKIYAIQFEQIVLSKIEYILEKDKYAFFQINIHLNEIDKSLLINKFGSLEKYSSKLLLSFIVSNDKELEFCYSLQEKITKLKHEIRPFYIKGNEEFIKEFVFIDTEDILNICPNKKQIFANQVINRNYFGKLTIQADGQLFDNLNYDSVGTLEDCMEDMIHKIIKEGRSWRCTRDNNVCRNCLHKLICPPPSNLELLIGSETICQKPRTYSKSE